MKIHFLMKNLKENKRPAATYDWSRQTLKKCVNREPCMHRPVFDCRSYGPWDTRVHGRKKESTPPLCRAHVGTRSPSSLQRRSLPPRRRDRAIARLLDPFHGLVVLTPLLRASTGSDAPHRQSGRHRAIHFPSVGPRHTSYLSLVKRSLRPRRRLI